jgi:large subunit ribosomal protein L32
MPLPKRKKPRSRTRSRRAQWRGAAPPFASCPQCHRPVLPHHACSNCGTYAGRQVLPVS